MSQPITENFAVHLPYKWKYTPPTPDSVDVPATYHQNQVVSTFLAGTRNWSKILLLTHLKRLGMKAVEVYCPNIFAGKCNGPSYHELFPLVMNKVMLSDLDESSSEIPFQLFDKVIEHAENQGYPVVRKRTFIFNISATSCVDDYQFKLMDRLLKSQLKLNWKQQQSDVVVIVNRRPYPCHKAILAARSPVFLDKFKANPNLKEVGIVADPLTSDADVQQFLEFVYTGQSIKPLTSKQLSQLAKTFKVKTLIELCDCAQRDVTMAHMMNLAVQLEPYLADYDPTVETRSTDDDYELPLDPDISLILEYSCSADLGSAWTMLHRKQSVTLSSFHYRGQPMFHCEMTKFHDLRYLVFTAINVGKIGLKIEQVTYSAKKHGNLRKFEMKEKRTPFETKIQIFKHGLVLEDVFNLVDTKFYVKLGRQPSLNFGYQLVDATWTDQLWKAAKTKQLTDVEFLVDGKAFGAHLFIVSARSPVFAAMFSTDMIEANTGTVTINDTDPDVFETFLIFLYTGALEPFSLANDYRLRALADKYQVDTLLRLCQSFPPQN